jgi:drug/metabolite transporter (DMT)-like permease
MLIKKRGLTMLLIVSLFATWSSVFTIGKMTVTHCPPLLLTSSRMILSGILIITYLLIRKKSFFKLKKKQILPIIILAILSMYLTNALEFWGLKHLSAGKTSFIYSLTPFFAALFSYIHFKEKMNLRKWGGMIIGFLGIIPAMYIKTGSENTTGGLGIFSWAELAIVGATLFSIYGWVLLRLLVKDSKLSPLVVNGSSMLLGGILALIHSLCVESWTPFPVTPDHMSGFIKGTLLMTFISNIVCYNVYGYLLKKYTATFLSFVGLLSPFFASLSEWVFLKQTPSWGILSSSLIVVFGLWIVYKEELKQGYINTPKQQLQPLET